MISSPQPSSSLSPPSSAAVAPTLHDLISERVVLDTQGPLIYIGTLIHFDERGYWLTDADVHDRHDGHAGKELYVLESHLLEQAGTRNVNRKRVFVERHAVVSISRLADVVADGDGA